MDTVIDGWVRSHLAGIAARCPPGWNAAADVGVLGIELVHRDGGDGERPVASARLTSGPLSPVTTLLEYTNRQLALLDSLVPAFRLLDAEPATLGGLPARRVLVAFRSGPVHLTGDQWWAVEGDRAVELACVCPSPDFFRYEPVFAMLAMTVRLGQPSASRQGN